MYIYICIKIYIQTLRGGRPGNLSLLPAELTPPARNATDDCINCLHANIHGYVFK